MIQDDLDTDGIEHIAPLDADSVPDDNQAHFCMSCDTAIVGLYCASCGQKNDDYRRSIFQLFIEVIGSFTALESRIWRTWATLLFKPGKVAREFADGRRSHWSSPVRVYLAMSIILFGFLSLASIQLISLELDVNPREGVEKPISELTAEDLTISPDVRFFQVKRDIEARNAARNFDLIALKIDGSDGIKINIGTDAPGAVRDALKDTALEDFAEDLREDLKHNLPEGSSNQTSSKETSEDEMPEEALEGTSEAKEKTTMTFSDARGNKYSFDSWTEILFAIIKDPSKLNAAFYKYLPRIMFFMMPFTMLIGAIFVRGRGNALLYDHLVHAAYIHAVAFFLLFLGILLEFILPGDLVAKVLFIVLLIYLPLSLKRMFGRSWIKTIWTSYGVGFIYAFNMSIIMAGLLLIQVVRTIAEIGTPLPA